MLRAVALFALSSHVSRFARAVRLVALSAVGSALLVGVAESAAQTPVVLPSTITSIAGITPTASTVNSACPTNSQFTAQDVTGNGCPAVNAVFGGNERSMVVDGQGNIYVVSDTANPQVVRRIDARSGNISLFAGSGSGNACQSTSNISVNGTTYVQTDKTGDGCPVAYSGGFNGARGLGLDPYGNVLITTTGDNALHFVCTAVSPICTVAQARAQVMRNIAGCTTAATSYGTAVTGTTVGTAGDGTNAVQVVAAAANCTTGVAQMRQAAGDKWDNLYFADNSNNRIRVVLGAASITVNGVTVTNPLYAVEQAWVTAYNSANGTSLAAPTQGFVYPAAGGATACSAKTDAGGDGCPFYQTVINTSSYVQGLAVTADGDFLFADGLGRLRVIYMGGTAIRAALAANGVASPVAGTSYALIGNGSGTGLVTGGTFLYYNSALSGTYLGSSVSLQSSAIQRLTVDPAGNILIGDQAQVLFFDIYTGYVRRLGGGTTAASCNSTTLGDDCPISQSLFGAASSVLSVAEDGLGNLYIQDLANKLIRRVTATTLPATAVNGSLSSKLVVHAPAAGSTVSVAAGASPDITVGAATCAAANTDGSVDCSSAVTFAPKSLALRNEPVSIATTASSATTTSRTFLAGVATGSGLVFDTAGTPSTTVLGASTTANTAVIFDGQGNSYVRGSQGVSRVSAAGAVSNITSFSPTYFAVDAAGNVYMTNGTSAQILKYTYAAESGSYSASLINLPNTVPINGVATQGYVGPFTVDPTGTLYIADTTNKQLYKYNPVTGLAQQVTQTALGSPSAMTQDSYGNLLVIDGTSLLKIPANGFAVTTASPVANPKVTFPTALTAPTAVAADQGENLYVADSGTIQKLSLSGYQYTIPGVAGTGVAVDGTGNLAVVASGTAGVTVVSRNAETMNFGTDVATPYVGVFSNVGATAATGFNQTDTGGNYSFLTPTTPVSASAPNCNIASTALAGGNDCNVSIKFAPTAAGSGTVPDVVTFLPLTNTIGSLSLNGTKNGSTATTSTAISGNTSGLIYSTGTETTFTITVTQSAGTPSGVVAVSVDGGSSVNYTLGSGSGATATAAVPVAGLSAGSHTIVATYAGSAGIAGSTSTTTTFSIGQASTSVTWTPGATTQQYSAAVGNGVLNATATSSGVAVSGYFLYTATPSGGTAQTIHAASFLPIGTYALGVTFVPTDSVDFVGASASVPTYTVIKASTAAPIGTSQAVVAADGSGNYTTVQAAVNTIGATGGGSVYIKPGTYTGNVTVVQPNVSLRGLGGDPTAVVLTHAGGAFGGSGTYAYAGEFTAATMNGAQLQSGSSLFTGDEGSATLVVAKGVNTAVSTSTLIPNGFYGENFTLVNTYDSDNSTTTTTYLPGANSGTCTANEGPAMTYAALFNSSRLCASQALAIWTTADLSVMNNVYTASLQDTIYAGSQGAGSSGYVPARQYWFRGKVTGTVDYIFGDAAAVFDYSTIYSMQNKSAGQYGTIEAQNKMMQSGSAGDYLSGYVMNSNVFTTQGTGAVTYFGRPYGPYSTWIMLNSYVDSVNALGYEEFSGDTNLPTSTYDEYNDLVYTDPATGAADLNGVIYQGTGGNSGTGVTGTRETTSTSPGTPMASNAVKTSMTAAQATLYYPTAFLGTTVASTLSSTANFIPTTALAANANAFVPSGTSATTTYGQSITILVRPQTPGLGAVMNGTYTIPTGSYTIKDGTTTIASGTLDASGEAYLTTSTLAVGAHSLTWTYGGDANFSGSTTSTPLTITVNGLPTSTTLGLTASPITYGQSAGLTATVSPQSGTGTPTGNVTATVDSGSGQTQALSGGAASFSFTGLQAGSHSFSGVYAGDTMYAGSTSSALGLMVNKATLTATGSCANRIYGAPNVCAANVVGYQYTDSAATVFSGTPTGTTTATRISPAGAYPATPLSASLAETTFGAMNYTVTSAAATSFTVSGGAAQSILFAPLPNFVHGSSYQLTARATSGLPVTYTITAGSSIASVSGGTLTVTGAGAVTVQANCADASGNYAAAAAVSQSFTAQ